MNESHSLSNLEQNVVLQCKIVPQGFHLDEVFEVPEVVVGLVKEAPHHHARHVDHRVLVVCQLRCEAFLLVRIVRSDSKRMKINPQTLFCNFSSRYWSLMGISKQKEIHSCQKL